MRIVASRFCRRWSRRAVFSHSESRVISTDSGIEIDAVQVLGHDLVEVVDAGRRAELFEPRQHRPIFLRQSIEGGDEEGARAAGGIDDRQLAQRFEPCAPIGDSPCPVGRHPRSRHAARATRRAVHRACDQCVCSTRNRVTMSGV